MSEEEEKTRKIRIDKGSIMATERDLYCIAWIAEMYAARVDQIQRLLSRFPSKEKPFKQPGSIADTTTRDQIARWKRAGWIGFKRFLADEPGYAWVSRRGLQLVDLAIYTAHEPAATRLAHIYAVNQVRLWMDEEQEYEWKSERRYRSEQVQKLKKDQKLGPIPDGLITDKQGDVIAIEAEISAKKPAEVLSKLTRLVRRHESTGLGYEPAFPVIWFYVPDSQLEKLVQQAIDDLQDKDRERVSVLIEEDLIASRYRRR